MDSGKRTVVCALRPCDRVIGYVLLSSVTYLFDASVCVQPELSWIPQHSRQIPSPAASRTYMTAPSAKVISSLLCSHMALQVQLRSGPIVASLLASLSRGGLWHQYSRYGPDKPFNTPGGPQVSVVESGLAKEHN
jgi:hypothetical protein